jgi:UDP-2,4-diacetamido-2,4,6-trideoxy-beta-L-altropyranose hydrolase
MNKKKKTIVFRVDSSTKIGSGHLMRCLALADKLKKQSVDIYFIVRELSGNVNYLIQDNGYQAIYLSKTNVVNCNLHGYENWLTVTQEEDAYQVIEKLKNVNTPEYLIIDSYAISMRWETLVRPLVKKIMVIDDLANRKHNCDILLDQNFYLHKECRYKQLLPESCMLLLGPEFALLRDEFYKYRKKHRVRDGSIHNILVFFGGIDLTNETMKVLRSLVSLHLTNVTINVIVGQENPYKKEINFFATNMRCCIIFAK